MKRFTIAYLPFKSVTTRSQVLQTPPYTLIDYATATDRRFISQPAEILTSCEAGNQVWSTGEYITLSLTNFHQSVSNFHSHIPASLSIMWTITTTISNNIQGYVTLITHPNEFSIQTASAKAACKWYKTDNNFFTTNKEQQSS